MVDHKSYYVLLHDLSRILFYQERRTALFRARSTVRDYIFLSTTGMAVQYGSPMVDRRGESVYDTRVARTREICEPTLRNTNRVPLFVVFHSQLADVQSEMDVHRVPRHIFCAYFHVRRRSVLRERHFLPGIPRCMLGMFSRHISYARISRLFFEKIVRVQDETRATCYIYKSIDVCAFHMIQSSG
jgi:hypothetical protein